MDEHEKRVDLNSELGVTRRDLLRRGAIVGGTLLWVAPAIQSMAPKAFAASGGGVCAACYCYDDPKNQPGKQRIKAMADKGKVDLAQVLSQGDCDTFCTGFDNHVYCTGSTVAGCKAVKQDGNVFPYNPDAAGALNDLLDAAFGCD